MKLLTDCGKQNHYPRATLQHYLYVLVLVAVEKPVVPNDLLKLTCSTDFNNAVV